MISVYETPSMNLLNKSSIKIPNVEFFEWSPAESILSYYTPENGNIPARVTLMRIPNREILRTKNLFSVVECRMFWQSAGTYLLVKVSLLKSKKHQATNLEIFRVTEKDCPVEVLEFKTGETVSIISWETNGDKFISVSQEAQKQFINLYQMLPATNASVERIRLLKTMERRGINRISWSPAGRFVVLAHIGVGDVEFWDSEELNMVGSGEHYQLTDVEWDPTGRFVVSSVSFYQVSSDNGYMLWSFTGQLLHKQMIPKFKALNWRNRPASLLSKDQQAQIRRNFKEYSKEYDIMDIAQTNKASKDVVEKRVNAWLEWVEFRRKCAFEYVLPKAADDQVFDEVEEIFEEVIDEVEEEVKDTGYKLDDD